ncbi:MAG: aldo/keto reductase [Trueperaceae bacterium]|nr:aldo/keto reductase [Trueperaceae bacterium]
MDTRPLGPLQVSVVGLGCNNFGRRLDVERTKDVVDAALDAGVTFLDTADVYGGTDSEAFLGRVLRGRRDLVVLATKFGMPVREGAQGAHPDYVKRALGDSLRRLGTDHVDLYQLHRPDPEVPIADTLGALDELVQAGMARAIGCSNFSVAQLDEAADAAARGGGARFVSVQNEYSMLHRAPEADVLPASERLGMGFLPYFPLANGLLTGKYRQDAPLPEGARIVGSARQDALLSEANLATVERLIAWAADHGRELIDLAFAYLLAEPAVASVIAGATKPEQVRRNAATAGWRLTEAERAEVRALLEA